MRPLNLASQPFRNETLPAVLLTAALVVLLGVTVRHAFVVRGLLPARTSQLHREVAALEAEAERLRTEARSVKAPAPDGRVVAEWSVLKDLVDRRTFSWTGLFARLEQVLPREVRLISIAPDVEKGQVTLAIEAMARPSQAGLGLVGLLEARGEFEDVYPVSVSEKDGGAAEFHYTMRYLPGALTQAAAAEAEGAGDEEPEVAAGTAPSALPASPAAAGVPTVASPVPAPPVPAAAARPTPVRPAPQPATPAVATPEPPPAVKKSRPLGRPQPPADGSASSTSQEGSR